MLCLTGRTSCKPQTGGSEEREDVGDAVVGDRRRRQRRSLFRRVIAGASFNARVPIGGAEEALA